MRLMLVAVIGTLTGCGASNADTSDRDARERSSGRDPVVQMPTQDAAQDRAAEALSGETFADVGDTSTCTSDCSGHDAGFEWAKEEDVTDTSECSGNSPSFIEGCEAYAEALEEKTDEAAEEPEEET